MKRATSNVIGLSQGPGLLGVEPAIPENRYDRGHRGYQLTLKPETSSAPSDDPYYSEWIVALNARCTLMRPIPSVPNHDADQRSDDRRRASAIGGARWRCFVLIHTSRYSGRAGVRTKTVLPHAGKLGGR